METHTWWMFNQRNWLSAYLCFVSDLSASRVKYFTTWECRLVADFQEEGSRFWRLKLTVKFFGHNFLFFFFNWAQMKRKVFKVPNMSQSAKTISGFVCRSAYQSGVKANEAPGRPWHTSWMREQRVNVHSHQQPPQPAADKWQYEGWRCGVQEKGKREKSIRDREDEVMRKLHSGRLQNQIKSLK